MWHNSLPPVKQEEIDNNRTDIKKDYCECWEESEEDEKLKASFPKRPPGESLAEAVALIQKHFGKPKDKK